MLRAATGSEEDAPTSCTAPLFRRPEAGRAALIGLAKRSFCRAERGGSRDIATLRGDCADDDEMSIDLTTASEAF